MGHVYWSLGLYPRGEALLTRAVDSRRRVLGPEHPDTLASMDEMGVVFNSESRYAEAEKLNRQPGKIASPIRVHANDPFNLLRQELWADRSRSRLEITSEHS
jgi:hypothetical protein